MKSLITKILLAGLAVGVCAREYETGKLTEEIQCRKAQSYSYMLYLPSGYTPGRETKWPVLFAMDPGGGTKDGIRRYIKGAEKNNWIVAMSIQSKNGFGRSKHAIAAMVGDVFKRFIVDKSRCYASGMSGGARMAFWLANERENNIIGIIPCGAGDAGNRYSTRALAYGLCGGYCFNRWDMAITFNERIRKRGRLRFFPGGHVWADEDLIFDAITWLNGQYLAEKGTPEEVGDFSEMLFNEVLEKYEDDPYFAYEATTVLIGIPKSPRAADAKEIADKLEEDSKIKLYLQGLKAMDDFVEKHFDTEVGDCYRNRLTRRQKEDADLLLGRYGDTPLAPTIRDFGKPSDKL
ncbi:MAG: hypothetical protein DRP64_01485 [Verrucomicrobia bacterium]|nr:MAG: hypothetical protein DRP64_01485 [Verrucomicrobiota bacterium]